MTTELVPVSHVIELSTLQRRALAASRRAADIDDGDVVLVHEPAPRTGFVAAYVRHATPADGAALDSIHCGRLHAGDVVRENGSTLVDESLLSLPDVSAYHAIDSTGRESTSDLSRVPRHGLEPTLAIAVSCNANFVASNSTARLSVLVGANPSAIHGEDETPPRPLGSARPARLTAAAYRARYGTTFKRAVDEDLDDLTYDEPALDRPDDFELAPGFFVPVER